MYSVTSVASYFSRRVPTFNRDALKNRFAVRPTTPSTATTMPLDGVDLTINVSGTKFRINESLLDQFPETLLGNQERRNNFYDQKDNEYFFDRDPFLFKFIYRYYKLGKLHFPDSECCEAYSDELDFFEINLTEIAPCCCETFATFLMNKIKEKEEDTIAMINKKMLISDDTSSTKPSNFRFSCWNFVEEPHSSYPALVFYYVSCVIIMLSIIMNCVETIDCPDDVCNPRPGTQGTNSSCVFYKKCGEVYDRIFFVIDTFCVIYFCVEYLMRLYGAPTRLKFLSSKMGMVDLLAILPYFIDLFIKHLNFTQANRAAKYVEMLRSFRIVRIIKLVRHSMRLKQLASTITRSISELGFIMFMYSIVVIVFASVIFYAEAIGQEKGESVFGSMPEAIWYTIVTTTTLG